MNKSFRMFGLGIAIVGTAALILWSSGSIDGSTSPSPAQLVNSFNDLDGKCRGGSGDDRIVIAACEDRDKSSLALEKIGWCYSSSSEVLASGWAKCDPESYASNAVSTFSHPKADIREIHDRLQIVMRETQTQMYCKSWSTLVDFKCEDRKVAVGSMELIAKLMRDRIQDVLRNPKDWPQATQTQLDVLKHVASDCDELTRILRTNREKFDNEMNDLMTATVLMFATFSGSFPESGPRPALTAQERACDQSLLSAVTFTCAAQRWPAGDRRVSSAERIALDAISTMNRICRADNSTVAYGLAGMVASRANNAQDCPSIARHVLQIRGYITE